MTKPIILSLCDYSGEWSRPYRKNYEVIMVDLNHPPGEWRQRDGSWRIGVDIRDFTFDWPIHGALAAPPCTCFCRPAACWWNRQDESGATARDVEVMQACLRLCRTATRWWALENPPGRHRRLVPELGPPAWQFHPFEYGDPWSKQTYIWGTAKKPRVLAPVAPAPTKRCPNGKTQGPMWFKRRRREREKTPRGFALAFARENQ